jgi:hypothetical protein
VDDAGEDIPPANIPSPKATGGFLGRVDGKNVAWGLVHPGTVFGEGIFWSEDRREHGNQNENSDEGQTEQRGNIAANPDPKL